VPVIRGSALQANEKPEDPKAAEAIWKLMAAVGQLHSDPAAAGGQAVSDADRGHFLDHGAGDGGDGADRAGDREVGEEIEIVGMADTRKSVVTGVEMFRSCWMKGKPGITWAVCCGDRPGGQQRPLLAAWSIPRSRQPTLSPACPSSSSLRNISNPSHHRLARVRHPHDLDLFPTFTIPRSIRPVTTVPRPVIEKMSSIGIRNGLSPAAAGSECSCPPPPSASRSPPPPSGPPASRWPAAPTPGSPARRPPETGTS